MIARDANPDRLVLDTGSRNNQGKIQRFENTKLVKFYFIVG